MNFKNKIIALVMSFVICFTSFSNSFANNDDYINTSSIAGVTGFVITKETFNIIIGLASACGVALLTDTEKLDFADSFINNMIRHKYSGKVDSGDFSTTSKNEIIKELEEEVKNGSSKDPNNNKLFVSSSLVASFMTIFNLMKDNEDKGSVTVGGEIPYYPKWRSVSSSDFKTHVKGSLFILHLPNNDRIQHEYYNNSIYPYVFVEDGVQKMSVGDGNNWSYAPCDDSLYYSCSKHDTNKKSGYYHVAYIYGIDYKPYVGSLLGGSTSPKTYYLPKVTMGSYVPIVGDKTVANDDFVGSSDNISVGGTLDLPSAPGGSAPGGSDIDFELPPVPGFDDEGIDLSFLTDLFEHLKGKFPFSIPFDLYNLIDVLRTEPIAPKFDFKFLDNEICLDLTQFESWANIVRAFSVFSWVFVLFAFTKKLGG